MPTAIPTNNGGILYGIGSNSTGDEQALTYQPATGFYAGSYNIGTNPIQSSSQSCCYNINKWYYVVVTRDSNYINMYINGTLITAQTASLINNQVADYGNAPYAAIIGSRSNLSTDKFFTGKIDDIRIYNRVLDLTEISALNNEGINKCSITVTDTLIINANLTGFNPITYQNNIKIYPNPTFSQITIDCGSNFSTISNYTIKITNTLGQTVYTSLVNKQISSINLSNWTGKGVYAIQLIDANSNLIANQKIVLE